MSACSEFYREYRKSLKAPVMLVKDNYDSYYVEAKYGTFRADVIDSHCGWCAKVEAINKWEERSHP